MLSTFTSYSPTIIKNRYEILFFNKEAMCTALSSVNKLNSSSSSLNQPLLNNNINNANNTPKSELVSEINQLKEENISSITEEIKNVNINKCKIDFRSFTKKNDIINYYNILKDCSYLRLYFRYTNNETLMERFKKNSKKNFNYVKKYNISIFKIIIDYINKIILKKKENYITDIKNNYKKLDKNTIDTIDNLLNEKVSSEEDHYEKIKDVLEIIKQKTDGFINYCIILDIKKTKFTSINSIEKKKNSNNFQSGGFNMYYLKILFIYYIMYMTKEKNPSQWYCLSKGKKSYSNCMKIEQTKSWNHPY